MNYDRKPQYYYKKMMESFKSEYVEKNECNAGISIEVIYLSIIVTF